MIQGNEVPLVGKPKSKRSFYQSLACKRSEVYSSATLTTGEHLFEIKSKRYIARRWKSKKGKAPPQFFKPKPSQKYGKKDPSEESEEEEEEEVQPVKSVSQPT